MSDGAALPQLAERLAALPNTRPADPEALYEIFLEWTEGLGIELYPAQEEALLELLDDNHVVLTTPTGSGKSLVGVAAHMLAIANGRRSYYTSPIKALVSEKFFDLCETFGPERVGMMTGDASVNRDAEIICCTAEILANICLRGSGFGGDEQRGGGERDDPIVVMDEFHYYSDRDRGMAWQVPLLTLKGAQFLLMSATLGDMSVIKKDLKSFTGREVAEVGSTERPVPLTFSYRDEDNVVETVQKLVQANKAPIYMVHFTQRDAATQAQGLMSWNLCDKPEKLVIRKALAGFAFTTPYGKVIKRYLEHGVGLHHGGLLPRYRLLVERLSRKGLLKVICGTDTLGVGVNVPIRTVLFTQLCKFDGEKVGLLSVRDFKQIAGRAGRKGFDDQGWVVAQAPAHVIENKRLEQKVKTTGRKKFVRQQPPRKGYVPWNEETFKNLAERPPEPLSSTFKVTFSLLLQLLQRDTWPWRRGGGYRMLMILIARSHVVPGQKRRLRRHSREIFRALKQAGIVEVHRVLGEPGSEVFVNPDLQRDFSLMHSLSLFLVEALPVLDQGSADYGLDVLSFVEAIVEHPRAILFKQLSKIKGELVAEMKAAGIEYEQRMEKLEETSNPKPKADLIYSLYETFCEAHPWMAESNVRPKSIMRDMLERYASFNEYTKELGLETMEGTLLRYLSGGYKTLIQCVPESLRTDAVEDVIAYFRVMLGQVDASLVQEWERMMLGEGAVAPGDVPVDTIRRAHLARDPKALTARIRAELHGIVRALSQQDWESAATLLCDEDARIWDAQSVQWAMSDYLEAHDAVLFNHSARLTERTVIEEDGPLRWRVSQALVDPQGDCEWALSGWVDLNGDEPIEDPLFVLDHVAR